MMHGPSIKTDHAIGDKANLNKLKNNKISSQVFSGYREMKLKVTSKTDLRNTHTEHHNSVLNSVLSKK